MEKVICNCNFQKNNQIKKKNNPIFFNFLRQTDIQIRDTKRQTDDW